MQENALAQRGLKFNKNQYHRKIDAETKYIWNNYLLKPFRDNLVTDKWCLEIVHGYVGGLLLACLLRKILMMKIQKF